MQSTGDFHHEIVIEVFSIAEQIFDNAASFHPTNDMFNHNANPGNQAIFLFLFCGELVPFRFFLWLKRLDRCGGIPLETRILIERYVFGIRRGFFIGYLFISIVVFWPRSSVPHLARTGCCLANKEPKISSTRCPSWRGSCAYKMKACMSAWAC